MSSAPLSAETDLQSFFREPLQRVITQKKTPISENAAWYLSGVLAEHSHRDEEPETLVELAWRASQAPAGRALPLWKALGDHALVTSGFFHEHLERRRLSRNYYEGMGAGAYARVGRLWSGEGFGEIFEELSHHFSICVELLVELKQELRCSSDTDILALYQSWCATGSPRIAERLRRLGVVPVRVQG